MILGAEAAEVAKQVLIFWGCWIGIWTAIAFPLFQKFQWRPFQPTPPEQKLILLIPLYLTAPLIVWGANTAFHRSWSSIGVLVRRESLVSVAIGLGIAVSGLLLVLLLKRALGLISFDTSKPLNQVSSLGKTILTIVALLPLGIWIGGIEELVFRGWLQTQFAIAFSPWIAATLSSLIFAIAHLVWDGRAGLWQQPGLFLLGWVLVIARWVDGGNLALAWGLHAGWVWGLACIGEFLKPQPAPDQPVWLTGRTAQPLTDLFDLSLMLMTAGLIWWLFVPQGAPALI
jgi:membrane protease YdiL (CAAX protease family)